MSNLDLVILGLLRECPRHGYEIYTITGKNGMDRWLKVKKPSVYKALNRLEEQGYITGEYEKLENHPPRKIFRINHIGDSYFLKLLHNVLSQDFSCDKTDFWHALRFIKGNLTQKQFIDVIQNRKEQMIKWGKIIREKIADAEREGEMDNQPFIASIMRDQFKAFYKIEFQTLDRLEEAAKLAENQKDFAKEE
jgi:DNA-binding PadR family transcriptional regulator